MMTGRERFMTALENKKPDRMPCQAYCWTVYYLNTYLGGIDGYAAAERFGLDPVISVIPNFVYNDSDLAKWQINISDKKQSKEEESWIETIETPKGALTQKLHRNQFTTWITEPIIKNEADFELWNEFIPIPAKVDWRPVIEAQKRVGDKGIVRSGYYDFGQGSPFQSFETLYGMEKLIMTAMDKPDWLHYVLNEILKKKLTVIERGGKFELDLIETGGGSGSSTVISPSMHRKFCLPYDKIQHQAIHNAGAKVTYHLCGGIMPLLETVVENEADALETMTPPEMGGDCILAEATKRIGDKICFIGGFDQNKGFENGNPELVKKMVKELFEACPDGGYICSPSDHFFFGDPENIQAFVEAAKECKY